MPNRREFLQTSAAVSALAVDALVPRDAAAIGAVRPTVPLHEAIVDDRYALAGEFVAALGAHGVPARALDDGVVTRLWVDELEPLWRTRAVAVAGLTQWGPMFVVGRLAAERGLAQALLAEHRVLRDGSLAHAVTAPVEVLAWIEAAAAAGLEWPTLMALAACRCERAEAPQRSATLTLAGAKPQLSAAALERAATEPSFVHYYVPRGVQQGEGVAIDGPLYSWVMVPRAAEKGG
jgi:hypothetical protein